MSDPESSPQYNLLPLDSLRNPSPIEKIIGDLEKKRATKTFIPDSRSAFLLAALRNYAIQLADFIRKAGGSKESMEEIFLKYSAPAALLDLHEQLTEHFVSVGGKSLDVVSNMAATITRFEGAAPVPSGAAPSPDTASAVEGPAKSRIRRFLGA